MTLDDRVGRLIDQREREILELFQSTGDRTKDLMDMLQKLVDSLPLIQDIKTEIADIQHKVSEPPKDDSDDDKDDEDGKPLIEDNTDPDVLKFLEDLTNSLLDLRQLNDRLLLDNPNYPALPGWGKGKFYNNNDRNFVRLFYYLYKKLRDLKDSVNNATLNKLSSNQLDYIRDTVGNTNQVVGTLENLIITKTQDISSALEECCSHTEDTLSDLKDDILIIKRKVNELSPEADNNKDLALQSRARAILAEIQAIRGLL